jgi:hypothetical protein
MVSHRWHDNEISTSFLSGLRSADRGESMVLACLDLGAMALCVMRHALAFRFSPTIDDRNVCAVIPRVDNGGCGVLHDVPDFCVGLGVSTFSDLHGGDVFHLYSW